MRALVIFFFATPLLAADAPALPKPAATKPDEPLAKTVSLSKAGEFLDGVGVGWTRERKCVTCHTNLPYLMARPLLDDANGWREVRTFLENDVAAWANGKTRGDAYVVATAAGLAFTDVHSKKLSETTKTAFAKMWAVQKPTGEWNWLKCAWPPMEHDDYYGAVLAAVAVGIAPDDYAKSDEAKAGLAKLKTYLAKTPAPDLHHRAMLLWAATKIDGLMTSEAKLIAINELRKTQRDDGGWSLAAMGTYQRRDGTMNDATASDGYGTGLAIYVMRAAGIAKDDAAIAKGLTWLHANQRESGRWYTRSLNNDKAHYITNAGTAFAVMAIKACE